MISAEDHRQRSSHEYLAHRLLGAPHMVLEIVHVSRNIAAIYRLDRFAEIERAADIKIVALERTYRAVASLADRSGCAALIVVHILHGIRRAVGNTEKRDVRVECVEIGMNR